MFLHITDFDYLDGYKLRLEFSNGIAGVVDLEAELYGEIFDPLRDQKLFRQVYLTSRTIEWPNGADLAPEYLLDLVQTQQATQPAMLMPA